MGLRGIRGELSSGEAVLKGDSKTFWERRSICCWDGWWYFRHFVVTAMLVCRMGKDIRII